MDSVKVLNILIGSTICLLILVIFIAVVNVDKGQKTSQALEQEKSAGQAVDESPEQMSRLPSQQPTTSTRIPIPSRAENQTEQNLSNNNTELLDQVKLKLNEQKLLDLKYLSTINFERVNAQTCPYYINVTDQQREKAKIDLNDIRDQVEKEKRDVADTEALLDTARAQDKEADILKYTEKYGRERDQLKAQQDKQKDMQEYISKIEYTQDQLKIICS